MSAPCPHVTPAMIAAGFATCAVCADPARKPTDDGTTAQEAALAAAYTDLAAALDALADAATEAAKIARRKKPAADLGGVLSAVRALTIAEQHVDTATYDLHTARGGDG